MKRDSSTFTASLQGSQLRRDSELPLYEQLAQVIAAVIHDGTLTEGARLPPHRELAQLMDINITTVTKAIARLKAMGLVESRPGRGTLVAAPYREPEAQFQSSPSDMPGLIDLSVNRPATDHYLHLLKPQLTAVAQDPRYIGVDDYQPPEGPSWARQATAGWLQRCGVSVDPEACLITMGAQHGLASIVRSVVHPGDVLLADAVTYQGINALAQTHGIHLYGVTGDERGMDPEALERACREHRPRALFLVPTLHNPTTRTLDSERRRALVAVAQSHDLLIIEDDVYRALPDPSELPRALVELAPERTFHVSGFSKCVAPGLRFGVVVAPERFRGDLAAAVRVDCWSMPPLSTLIATRLIESGDAARIVQAHREELGQRQALLAQVLEGSDILTHPASTHAWLRLPEPWRGSDFARKAYDMGVAILPAAAFTLRQAAPPHAVRINLAAARSREELERALTQIAELLSRGHRRVFDMV